MTNRDWFLLLTAELADRVETDVKVKYIISLLIAMVMLYTVVLIHIPRFGISRVLKIVISATLTYGMLIQAVFIIGGIPIWIGLLAGIILIPIGIVFSVVATEMFKNAYPWAQPRNKNKNDNARDDKDKSK